MTGPPPAVARVRVAVRRVLSRLPRRQPVLVACSGGPDSMALAAATAFVAPRLQIRAGLVTVDHGLQDGSSGRASTVAEWARSVGFAPAEIATVDVDVRDGGPEAAARTARYAALSRAARRIKASAILLGHTQDDQAETVLLALARGSGPRGIAGMARHRGEYYRPLLDLPRTDTVQACRDLALPIWDDPHNTDPAYLRSRLRSAMPVLTETLGNRLITNLARTASLIAVDNEALDFFAADLLDRASHTSDSGPWLDVETLAAAPTALHSRALRAWVLANGAEADGLGSVHIEAMVALVADWHGQGPVFLPGKLEIRRVGKRLRLGSRS